jgi:hypothetical protein
MKLTDRELRILHQINRSRFDIQRRIALDPARKRLLLAGRQSGKTQEIIHQHVEALLKTEGVVTVFIGLSKNSAKRIFYKRFEQLSTQSNWGFQFNSTDLSITAPNGNITYVFGSDDQSDIERARGLTRVKLFTLDEAGQWRQDLLRYTIEEAAFPATGAVNGKIIVSGTPPRVLRGYFVDAINGIVPNWSVHQWDARQNPHMPANWLRTTLDEFGWSYDNPIFRREYLAELVRDEEALIFPYSPARHVKSTPALKWETTLAVDFGVVHNTAFVVLGTNRHVKPVYVLYACKETGLTTSQVANKISTLVDEYEISSSRMFGDLGGLGKAYANDLSKDHGIYLQCAEKRDKLAGIERLVDAFRTDSIALDPAAKCLQTELQFLSWNDEHSDIASGQVDDAVMALVYGYRSINHAFIANDDSAVIDPYFDSLIKPRKQHYASVSLLS